MAEAVLKGKLSKDASASFLEAARQNLQFLGHLWSSPDQIIKTTAMVEQIPKTQEAAFHCLGLLPNLTTRICCQKCFALYPLELENPKAPTKCQQSFLSQYQGYCKWAKLQKLDPTCDQELYKLNKNQVSTPIRTYTYVMLYSWLKQRVEKPSFKTFLDSSLSATSWKSDDPMEDVWHGSVWRDFPNADDGS